MYGTIARLHVIPGKEAALRQMVEAAETIPGHVFNYVYRSDGDPREYWLVVGFESRAAYRANAESPAQHQRYEQYRQILDAEPEWHDGEIVAGQGA